MMRETVEEETGTHNVTDLGISTNTPKNAVAATLTYFTQDALQTIISTQRETP